MRAEVNAEGSALCARCGTRHPARHIRIDHVIPLSAGGRDVRANLQALCTPCHAEKSLEDEVARYTPGTRGGP